MFTRDNFTSTGIEYDYAELNIELAYRLNSGRYGATDDLDAEKNASDAINNELVTKNGRVMIGTRYVGTFA